MVLLLITELSEATPEPTPLKDSLFSCTVALAFSGIGAGILSLPWALSTLGLLGGVAALSGTAALSCLASFVLLDAKRQCPCAEGFAGVIAHFWPHQWAVNLVVFIDCFGALVVFVDYCADAILSSAVAFGSPVPPTPMAKAAVSILAVPFSLPPSISYAAVLSPLCLGALGYISALVVLHAVNAPRQVTEIALVRLSSSSLQGLCAFFFAFVSHMNLFDVMARLQEPTRQRKRLVALLATLLMLVAYASVSACGYLAFGDGVRPDVLTNFPPCRLEVKLANLAMVCMLLVCYVLVIYPVRSALLGLLALEVDTPRAWAVATLLAAGAPAAVSIAFPSVVDMLSVLGGLCAPCIVFVFPALTLRAREAPGSACALYAGALLGFAALAQSFLVGTTG